MTFDTIAIGISAVFSVAASSHGDIVWFNDIDEWKDMAGESAAIEFAGFQNGTVITDQYADFGIVFSGNAFIQEAPFWSDGFGLFGNDGIAFTFETPRQAIAVDFVGVISFALFKDGNPVGTFGHISTQWGTFAGITSSIPFDEVHIFKPNPPFDNNVISIDTLYWGAPVPGPGALTVFGAAMLIPRRRRRQS